MIVDFAELSPSRIYFTMTQTLVPRPIAWILSDNGNGDYNLAPFSYFNGVCSDPPLVMLSIGKKPDKSLKDSRANIIERKQFTIHIAHRELAPLVTESSRVLPFGESEQRRLGLELVPFGDHPVPRLSICRVAYACEFYQLIELGPLPQALILARVKAVYIDDAIAEIGEKNRLTVHADKLDPLGRLGGEHYGTLGGVLRVPLPRGGD